MAFSFGWSNESVGDPPYVQLYLPLEERFPHRNQLLNRIRPQLKRAGFTDHYEGESDPIAAFPLWRSIRLEFNGQAGVDLPAILSAILKGFQDLMEVEKPIEEACQSLPAPPPPSERVLKTIAFLDTEWSGAEPARKMTELAIVNVAYDPLKDEVVGILEEYVMNIGEKPDIARRAQCWEGLNELWRITPVATSPFWTVSCLGLRKANGYAPSAESIGNA